MNIRKIWQEHLVSKAINVYSPGHNGAKFKKLGKNLQVLNFGDGRIRPTCF